MSNVKKTAKQNVPAEDVQAAVAAAMQKLIAQGRNERGAAGRKRRWLEKQEMGGSLPNFWFRSSRRWGRKDGRMVGKEGTRGGKKDVGSKPGSDTL